VRVVVDGRTLIEHLDGKPIELDPGTHRFRYEAAGFTPIEESLVLALGDKRRMIVVTFQAKRKARALSRAPARAPVVDSAPTTGSGLPTESWIFAGVGVGALAAGAYFGVRALDRRSELEACRPQCAQDDVDAVERDYIVSEVGIGVGLVALAAAGYFALTASDEQLSVSVSGRSGAGEITLGARF
jgi:hypothetical protein